MQTRYFLKEYTVTPYYTPVTFPWQLLTPRYTLLHLIFAIYAIRITRGSIKPYMWENQFILATFAYQTRPDQTRSDLTRPDQSTPHHITKRPVCHLDFCTVRLLDQPSLTRGHWQPCLVFNIFSYCKSEIEVS